MCYVLKILRKTELHLYANLYGPSPCMIIRKREIQGEGEREREGERWRDRERERLRGRGQERVNDSFLQNCIKFVIC